jgi:hypothetical protein
MIFVHLEFHDPSCSSLYVTDVRLKAKEVICPESSLRSTQNYQKNVQFLLLLQRISEPLLNGASVFTTPRLVRL